MAAFGQSVGNSQAHELEQLYRAVGLTCRCLPCCCSDGRGHNHPQYERMLELQDVIKEGRRS